MAAAVCVRVGGGADSFCRYWECVALQILNPNSRRKMARGSYTSLNTAVDILKVIALAKKNPVVTAQLHGADLSG